MGSDSPIVSCRYLIFCGIFVGLVFPGYFFALQQEFFDMSTGIMEVIQPGQSPKELMRLYESRAESCREIIRQTSQNIGGRDHIRVEGW